jgi:NAD(P)-dependent dehydrogenase (short-subunit alcohol dehydrogenase family)
MLYDFHDRVVLITGASGGIGRVLARRYAQCGASLVLAARRQHELEDTGRLVTDAGGKAMVRVTDIRVEDQCHLLVHDAVARFGRLDVLVNNAAVPGRDEAIVDATVENWHDTIATNLLAPMVLAREALRQAMVPAASGNIQFLSSAAAKAVHPRKAHYAVAKMGLLPLAQTLAIEVGPLGIRVNTLVVGGVAGELIDRYVTRIGDEEGVEPDVVRTRIAAGAALKRLVLPEEVADVSLWLASEASSAITGQNINVTAGGEKR